ncbi:MAG TPA: hypothetical protein VFP00_11895, partial [Burkholderiales bacterium]|nr:hypothetical protein [Burkholderiales bacterium]
MLGTLRFDDATRAIARYGRYGCRKISGGRQTAKAPLSGLSREVSGPLAPTTTTAFFCDAPRLSFFFFAGFCARPLRFFGGLLSGLAQLIERLLGAPAHLLDAL